jgi:hypothetical protein
MGKATAYFAPGFIFDLDADVAKNQIRRNKSYERQLNKRMEGRTLKLQL